MISMSSVVIAAWRLRLYWMVSLLISSPALRVALSIAVIEAPDTTVYVPAGVTAERDGLTNIVLTEQ